MNYWWCTVDMSPRATQLVLGTLDRRCQLPLCAEGTGWRGCMDPGRVIRRVETLEARYGIRIDAFVLTARTPQACADALRRRGYRIETVLDEELEDVVELWRSLGLQCRWRRGEWLCGLAMSRLVENPNFAIWTGWDWIYAGLSRHVRSLGDRLQREGLASPSVSGQLSSWAD